MTQYRKPPVVASQSVLTCFRGARSLFQGFQTRSVYPEIVKGRVAAPPTKTNPFTGGTHTRGELREPLFYQMTDNSF